MLDCREAVRILTERGKDLVSAPRVLTEFTTHKPANELVNDLDNHPHAFVVACILDRQMSSDFVWTIPWHLRERLGSFELEFLAVREQSVLAEAMAKPTSLHRYHDKMSRVLYEGIRIIAIRYEGDAARIWCGSPPSAGLVRRFLEFPGVGPKIASMTANMLVRDFKIPLSDYHSIDISVDVHIRRVLKRIGVVDQDASPEEIIYAAREHNPDYPGVIDLSLWEIGRAWCKPSKPACEDCYLRGVCRSAS